ncbi:MAG: hypothetical protein ABSC48_14655 [Terracidiphilus sp.]
MRRIPWLLLTLALLPAASFAQFQRLALAFGEYSARAGSSIGIPTFCIDPHREAPPENAAFHYSYGDSGSTIISYGGKDYSPTEAAAAGIGEFVAGDTFHHAIFRPKVPGDVRIRVKSGTILSEIDEPITVSKSKALNQVLSTATQPKRASLSGGDAQDSIWERAVVSDQQTILRDIHLYTGNVDGLAGPKFDRATDDFETKSGEEASLHSMLDYAVLTKASLSEDGKRILKDETRARVGAVGFHGDRWEKQFREYHGLPDGPVEDQALVNALQSDENIADEIPLAFLLADGQRAFLVENNGLEAWTIEKGIVSNRLRGASAVEAVDGASASVAQEGTKDGKTYIYPFTYDDGATSVYFQVGNERIAESRSDVETFISGTGSLPKLEAALGAGRNGGGGKPPIFIYRGLFDDELPNSGGNAIPISTALSSVRKRRLNPSQFAAQLRARYGDRADVFLASDTRRASHNADSITPLKGPQDLAVLKGEKVNDWGALDDLVQSLKKAKIPLIEGSEENFEAGNLMVLTGHRDQNLVNYLESLRDNGTLEDKVVLLFSCYAGACESSHTALLRSFGGPKAVLYFPEEINKNAAIVVIKEFINELGSAKYTPTQIADLLNLSVERAAAKNPPLRDEIMKLKNVIVQVSEVRAPGSGWPIVCAG